ncbi:MAG: glycosyltransferase family 9 protein [Acidobacteria bacterium]|nr:glycosyltransferase family 9 protein [Acidobacteriota bacterium]
MPRRRRWTPVRGTGNRIYDPLERLLVGALDLPGRAAAGALRLLGPARGAGALDRDAVREVLVLRLDRIGDVLMSLPALADLRAALPRARIRLAVGRWSEAVARSAPVDELLVWSAPWVGRAAEGAEGFRALAEKARGLRGVGLDLALDLQGDVRASILAWLSGARARVGYANTGGGYLLTHVVPLDETVSWVEQNRRAVAAAVGPVGGAPRLDPLGAADRDFARRLLENLHLDERRPLVAIHPSGGRLVKQWEVARWLEVGARLEREFGATILVTGSEADRPLAEALRRGLHRRTVDLAGRLSVRETLALVERLDLFLSPDTGPMHMACAVGTPSVAVFGPSDPARYFSGGDGRSGSRHVVVRAELWCAPCNLIRRPPAECAGPEPPECLRLVTVEEVHREAVRLLREAGGYAPLS